MRIGLRVYVYSMLVIVAALALLGLMSIVKYETILTETMSKRLAVVIEDARASVEKAGSLGVSLRALAQQPSGPLSVASQLIDDDARVVVVDARGELVSMPGQVGGLPVASAPLLTHIAARDKSWSFRDGGYLIVGSTIVNSFGESEGAIVALQPDAVITERDNAMLRRIISYSFITLMPIALLAAMVVFVSLRPLGRSIQAMRSVVEERDETRVANASGPLAPTLHWFGRIFGDLEQQRKEATQTLDAIEMLANAESRKNGQ
ncbi:hypothetical protein [Ciceribacter sp. L1K22]|uniref:hypothetical protein n=1 Tax=Ciceribacter sp. L1K22 TaxID=2820275 RepID=UPI001ABDC5A8|nr:hypothetical protein [Ciceribacter sp. L1K22]MBO3761705.1 hypothetical protein [Ciceribacter sp. L1K22]